MITLDRLSFDTTVPDNGANVGAYLRAEDGTLLTHTTVGGDQALDVNIVQSTGQFAEDSAHASGHIGNFVLAVRNDAGTSLVSADGDYSPFSVNASGAMYVAFSTSGTQVKLEDAASANGDAGSYSLAVRQDTPASSTSADGDFQSIKNDAIGRLWVNRSGQSATYDTTTVANTATDLIGTDLANRIKVIVQNTSNKNVFIGSDASVTTANGLRLSAGSSIELEVGAGVNLHGITSTGTADVRYFEVA